MNNLIGAIKSEWTSKQLLKEWLIAFIGSFVWTIVITFIALWGMAGFGPWATIFIYLLTISNAVAIIGAFLIAFIQMTGWIGIIFIRHYLKFKTNLSVNMGDLPISKVLMYWVGLAFILAVAPIAFSYVADLIGLKKEAGWQVEDLVIAYPIITLIMLPLIGAFEEVFFRGVMQNELAKTKVGMFGAIILSSSLFTALHAFQYGIRTLVAVFILSLILGSFYAKFRSLSLNMFGHFLNNLMAVVIILVSSAQVSSASASQMSVNDEFNVFVKMMMSTDGETNPYRVKYNPMYDIIANCKGSETSQKIYDEILMANPSDIRNTIDLQESEKGRKLTDKEKRIIELDFWLNKKKPFLSACNFDAIQNSFQKNVNHLNDIWSEESLDIAHTYVSIAKQLVLNVKSLKTKANGAN